MVQALLLSQHRGQITGLPALSLLMPLVDRREMIPPTQASPGAISNGEQPAATGWPTDMGFPI